MKHGDFPYCYVSLPKGIVRRFVHLVFWLGFTRFTSMKTLFLGGFHYPIGSMYGIFTYRTGSFMG